MPGELLKKGFLEPMGISNGYWLRAQAAYDIEVTEDALADQLRNSRPWNSDSPADRGA